jgi:HlyD family secretion protein
VAGLGIAYVYSLRTKPLPPVFSPAPNPYEKGIYANGIVEAYLAHGQNINIYPEVSGTITEILVAEGAEVKQGAPLIRLEDSVPRATAQQQEAQAEAAQVTQANAGLKTAQDQLDKLKRSHAADARAVSLDTLDNAVNAVQVAAANLEVVRRQYDLTRAGAWTYDIRNQERTYHALKNAAAASKALLDKYVVRAPQDGMILSINAAVGSYISSQGTYNTYTQASDPVAVMGSSDRYLAVRCYIDEILIHRLPPSARMRAQMAIRGTNITVPLEYVRVQPYVSPKIELSNQRTERVDLRVLPVIFRFERPKNVELYPGQLVDVYIGDKEADQ